MTSDEAGEQAFERSIGEWRAYVRRRQAIHATDLEELEDHLRTQIEDLRLSGLDAEEAFLIAVKRLGELDALSREFAREHSERLWKRLVVADSAEKGTSRNREIAVAVGLALAAAVAAKVPGSVWMARRPRSPSTSETSVCSSFPSWPGTSRGNGS